MWLWANSAYPEMCRLLWRLWDYFLKHSPDTCSLHLPRELAPYPESPGAFRLRLPVDGGGVQRVLGRSASGSAKACTRVQSSTCVLPAHNPKLDTLNPKLP